MLQDIAHGMRVNHTKAQRPSIDHWAFLNGTGQIRLPIALENIFWARVLFNNTQKGAV